MRKGSGGQVWATSLTAAPLFPGSCAALHDCCACCTFCPPAGFGGCAAVLAAFPHLQDSLAQVLGAVAALGITSSIAFGTSYQLVSGYGSSSTVGLTIGYVCSPPLVLLFEAALRLGPRCQWHEMRRLYGLVAAVPAVGLAVAVALLLQRRKADQRRQQQAQQLQPRHREQQLADSQEPLLQSASESGELSVLLDGGDGGGSGTVFAVWPAAASLALSIACSMFLFPFFTHFTSAGQFGMLLPVVLFWVRCFADILGRLLPKALPQPAPPLLLGLAALRLALLPLALMYIHGSLPALHSDFLLAAYVALQWLLSGAINAWSYLSVPRLVPPSLAAPAAAVISVTFNVACLAGLLLAIPFEALF